MSGREGKSGAQPRVIAPAVRYKGGREVRSGWQKLRGLGKLVCG